LSFPKRNQNFAGQIFSNNCAFYEAMEKTHFFTKWQL